MAKGLGRILLDVVGTFDYITPAVSMAQGKRGTVMSRREFDKYLERGEPDGRAVNVTFMGNKVVFDYDD